MSARDVPSLVIERYLAGAASEAEVRRVEGAFTPGELAGMRASHAALAKRLSREVPFARIEARRAARSRAVRTGTGLGLAFATAALTLLLVRPSGQEAAVGPTDQTRMKGLEPTLHVYRKRGERAERLAADARVRPHDVLQLGVVPAGAPCGVVLSLDGRGVVTLHHPQGPGEASTWPSPQGEQLLASAYELDDAPGFERFFLVTGACPLAVGPVLSAAEVLARDPSRAESASLALPTALRQAHLLLRKADVPQ